MFASSPVPHVGAGRGHRRGLDGPSMPKQSLNNRECFYPPAQVSPRQGGQGLVSQAVAPRLGHRWRGMRRCRTRPSPICRGLKLTERPRKSRPSRPGFRWPHAGETSPCPPCRRQGNGQREAHSAHRRQLPHQHLERRQVHGHQSTGRQRTRHSGLLIRRHRIPDARRIGRQL